MLPVSLNPVKPRTDLRIQSYGIARLSLSHSRACAVLLPYYWMVNHSFYLNNHVLATSIFYLILSATTSMKGHWSGDSTLHRFHNSSITFHLDFCCANFPITHGTCFCLPAPWRKGQAVGQIWRCGQAFRVLAPLQCHN
jgi:hypothetical protein